MPKTLINKSRTPPLSPAKLDAGVAAFCDQNGPLGAAHVTRRGLRLARERLPLDTNGATDRGGVRESSKTLASTIPALPPYWHMRAHN